MPNILALDTSTTACSCALVCDGCDGEVHEQFEIIPRQHAARLLGMIETLMASRGLSYCDLDAVAYGCGPGSFTGLRIAAGVTQGIALGADKPVVAVSSLASIALQSESDGLVFTALDAKIDEVYWGFYRRSGATVELVGAEGLCKPELLPAQLSESLKNFAGMGSGLAFIDRMPSTFVQQMDSYQTDIYPRAGTIARLAVPMFEAGCIQQPEDVSPVYLRDKVTNT
jgi:tRNA threonylcarbamoyladenosine biosynthesis protein TsaB